MAAATLSRWINGKQVPRGDGDLGPAWIAERTGVPAVEWDLLDGQPSTPPSAGPGAGRRGPGAPVEHPSPSAPGRAPSSPPARGAAGPGEVSPTPGEEVDDVGDDQPPATIEALQARGRQIPGELQRLRRRIASGATAVHPGEVMARMLEREARAVNSAIMGAGTATVEEVEQLRALVLDVTRGCEGCRARVTAALRGGGAA